ncbi:MAG: glutamine--fructose-6-phosphate transaminase (isomerizing) [Clostridia bacterium]|nr:glutamine--fructose-6-phosphate transaminase (isomerizing) [Clostridia bacterium]
MCGIVGYIGKNKAVPVLINGLLSLEYRGYDSAGIAVLNNNKGNNNTYEEIEVIKDKGRVKNIQNSKKLINVEDSNIGIAHTRWATHGKPSKENAHPHLDNSKKIAVVHNGIIENYSEIRNFLYQNGYELYSETDTEVIPNLIHYYYNKNKDVLKAVSLALKKLKGSYAIEVISPIFNDEIIVAKKESPLVIGVGKNEKYIASDIPAILKYTKDFYFMDDNEIAVIKEDTIRFYDDDLKEKNKELKNIGWDAEASEKNGYEDYMLKEIYEQPKAIFETIGTTLNGRKIDLPLEEIDFGKINKIYIVACGTAMHAGMVAKYSIEKYCKISTEVDMASEFRYRNPIIDENTLCIFISQSGETADTIAALKLAKEKHSKTLSIVNVVGSTISRISDFVLYTHAGPEVAVASTKAYTCQLTLLNIAALYIAEKIAKNEKDLKEIEKVKEEIKLLPNKVKETLNTNQMIKKLAQKFYNSKDIFYIGRNIDYGACLEASLKLKEISYIHSEGYAAGELKHGPIALIEKGVPVIGIITEESLALKTISNIQEVITRGADVVIVTNKKIEDKNYMEVIKIPECISYLSPILSIIPMQLLAYYIAKNKELDVDKPRNLAKSVTVE